MPRVESFSVESEAAAGNGRGSITVKGPTVGSLRPNATFWNNVISTQVGPGIGARGTQMPDTLGRLVYVSKATVSTDSLWVLTGLLAASQRNNDRDNVTGALAIADGWFFQVIEGPGSKLNNLLRRLEGDTRHTEIEVLSHREVSFRLFGEWSMCSSRITPEVGSDLAGLINECSASPDGAVAALIQIMARRAH